jgi:hypothetical protein
MLFVRGGGLAGVGDDSASYLSLARMFSGMPDPWAPYFTTFPPLFPLLLAAAGAASDLARAHYVVGACAAAALPLVYLHASRVLGSRALGLLIVLLFLLTATAWVSAKGILSEPAYLLASMAALAWHESRAEPPRGWAAAAVLGLLFAAGVATRSAGSVLVVAYVAQIVARAIGARRLPRAIELAPVAPALLVAVLWAVLRPMAGADVYGLAAAGFADLWMHDPAGAAWIGLRALFGGWLATFTGDYEVPAMQAALLGLLAILAVTGTVLRLRRNRLDGWYAALGLAVIVGSFFSEDNSRRLLYPLVPVLLVHCAVALRALLARAPAAARPQLAFVAVALPILGVALPSDLGIVKRARDCRIVVQGSAIRYCDLADYYKTLDLGRARAIAARHAAVLAGLEAISRATPADARVMWGRPEYVEILGHRTGVARRYAWDEATLARRIAGGNVDYLVIARLFKPDLQGERGDDVSIAKSVSPYARPALEVPNAVLGTRDFVLLRIDRTALAAYLGSGAALNAPGSPGSR